MRFQCEKCHSAIAIDDIVMGEPLGCDSCGEILVIPETTTSPRVIINDFVICEPLPDLNLPHTLLPARQITLDRPAWVRLMDPEYIDDNDWVIDFIYEARARAKDKDFQPRPITVAEEKMIYFQAYERGDSPLEEIDAILSMDPDL
ncbi:MAG: hypothetical protein HRT89_02490 [Lentisphaeria bacterium]|nr:hypothetical protein [Lentisphaeria bacterium]NQZ66917.1 hypothetical protein [Lentisphaeria bacterium]